MKSQLTITIKLNDQLYADQWAIQTVLEYMKQRSAMLQLEPGVWDIPVSTEAPFAAYSLHRTP